MPLVTFLTDFGLQDSYVGVMKGVVMGHCPSCQLIDLTHAVPPQDVCEGAFQLARAAPWFPPGTIHLAVVDPGVGSDRRALVIRTARACFVGPDNGLFDLALRQDPPLAVYALTVPETGSSTFHGRDVFAPAAGLLAAGLSPEEVGCATSVPLASLQAPQPIRLSDSRWDVQIVSIDRFGNCATNLLRDRCAEGPAVHINGRDIGFFYTYAQVEPGQPLALWSSDDRLEIAVREGSAAERLGIVVGTRLTVEVAKGG